MNQHDLENALPDQEAPEAMNPEKLDALSIEKLLAETQKNLQDVVPQAA